MFPYDGIPDEQWELICAQLGFDPRTGATTSTPIKRTAFDLEEQTDEDFAAFLAEVEANANAEADKELEEEAATEKRISDLKESVNE